MGINLDLNLGGIAAELNNNSYDLIIIGGGPAGLTAGIYGARAKLKTLILDKNPNAGALGTTDKIENYPGIPRKITGIELINILRKQAEGFGAEFKQEQVISVNFSGEEKSITTPSGTYKTKACIIATGAMGHKPIIKGEAELLGKGVSKCAVCDAAFFSGKKVAVIVSMLKEAMDEIHIIAGYANTVYFIPKGIKIDKETEQILSEFGNITILHNVKVKEITGSEKVEGVRLVHDEDTETEEILQVDGIFLYLRGNAPITDFLDGTIELTPEGCIKINPATMETNIKGVFAAGDVTCKEIRQAVIAAAEGAIAALSADKYLNKRRRTRSQWS